MMTITLCLMLAGLIYLAAGMVYNLVRDYRTKKQTSKPRPSISKIYIPKEWDGNHFNDFASNLHNQIKSL